MRAAKEHQEHTKSSSKASLLLIKRVVALWQQYYKRENGGRARENGEKNGQHGVALKLHVKNEERGLFFKGGREKKHPLHALQVSLPKEGGSLKGGGHHERGEHPLEEETQKWGKKPLILSLNLSLMPQCVEWAPHVVPITKWPIQWKW
jgi:hypothetical protein